MSDDPPSPRVQSLTVPCGTWRDLDAFDAAGRPVTYRIIAGPGVGGTPMSGGLVILSPGTMPGTVSRLVADPHPGDGDHLRLTFGSDLVPELQPGVHRVHVWHVGAERAVAGLQLPDDLAAEPGTMLFIQPTASAEAEERPDA